MTNNSPPLSSFGRANQKRTFSAATSSEDQNMDCSSSFSFQATKRRKRFNDTSVAAVGGENNNNFTTFQSKENWSLSPFATTTKGTASSSTAALPSSSTALPSSKRTRTSGQQHGDASPSPSAQKVQELQQVVNQQSIEIQRLKSEKETIQSTAQQLSTQNAKAEHENKILKRAVTIQQERGNQMNVELENARQFKVNAEECIRRLEQHNRSLQYQLQANTVGGSDFMGGSFPPRPPDVY